MERVVMHFKFTLAAVAYQALSWLFVCVLPDMLISLFVILILSILPTVLYIKFGSYVTEGYRIVETVLHCSIWLVTSGAAMLMDVTYDNVIGLFYSFTSIAGFIVLTPLAKFIGYLKEKFIGYLKNR